MVVDMGGEIKSSVTKDLTYLINSDTNSTSTKNVAAKKLGIKVISEDDFLQLVK